MKYYPAAASLSIGSASPANSSWAGESDTMSISSPGSLLVNITTTDGDRLPSDAGVSQKAGSTPEGRRLSMMTLDSAQETGDVVSRALEDLLGAPFKRVTASGFSHSGAMQTLVPEIYRNSRPQSANIPLGGDYNFMTPGASRRHDANILRWQGRPDDSRPITASPKLTRRPIAGASFKHGGELKRDVSTHDFFDTLSIDKVGRDKPDNLDLTLDKGSPTRMRVKSCTNLRSSNKGSSRSLSCGLVEVPRASLQSLIRQKIEEGRLTKEQSDADGLGGSLNGGGILPVAKTSRNESLREIDKLRMMIENEETDLKRCPNPRKGAPQPLGAAIAAAADLQHNDQPFVPETQTGLPVSDVHNYLLYCQYHKVTIMLRPVADGAAQAFIGVYNLNDPTLLDEGGYPILQRTEHAPWGLLSNITNRTSNARGKTMATALKSSPYNPLKGCVPLVAQLSKVGAAQTKLKCNLEAALIEAEKMQAGLEGEGGGQGTEGNVALTQVYARLKSMESTAVRMFDKIAADSKRAMEASRQSLECLMQEYQIQSMQATDKRKISEMYVDELNNSQFLGECYLRYGPLHEVVHFVGWKPLPSIESWLHHAPYLESSLPVFVLCPAAADGAFRRWDEDKSDFVAWPQGLPENTYPVPLVLVSSRQFYISEDTGRIEERPEGAVLVPDYDGLSFAWDKLPPMEGLKGVMDDPEQVVRILLDDAMSDLHEALQQRYVPDMGMVCEKDVEHVLDVRSLTDWRQNHGVESNNTVKTQEFTPGNYCCFNSDGRLHIVHNFMEAMEFFRETWVAGCPLKLNPNWNVLLDSSWLPIVPNDSVAPLFDLEGEEASFLEKLKKQATPEWDLPSIKAAYDRLYMKDTVEGWTGVPRNRDGKKASDVVTWRAYVKYRDKLKVMRKFFHIREVLLHPPYYLHHSFEEKCQDADLQKILAGVDCVREKMRDHQNSKVLQIASQLDDERKVFESKHGLRSTDFIDTIWDYLMVRELRCGFNDASFTDVMADEAEELLFHDAKPFLGGVVSAPQPNGQRQTHRDGVLNMRKGADNKFYTPGEHLGMAFMKRVNAAMQYSSHDPWTESKDDPIMRLARQEPATVSSEAFVSKSTASRVQGVFARAARSSLASIRDPSRSRTSQGRAFFPRVSGGRMTMNQRNSITGVEHALTAFRKSLPRIDSDLSFLTNKSGAI